MKTATIEVYRQYGSRYDYYYADVYYKGKRISRMEGHIEREVVKDVVDWTIENGFTHYKLKAN